MSDRKKRVNMMDKLSYLYSDCTLCARQCHIDRTRGELGYCAQSDKMRIARAAPHYFEEPIISGEHGSGTIFFVGCSLGCIYCQNYKISKGQIQGREVSTEELSRIMLELQNSGVHNINLVTPTHFAPGIVESIDKARADGLKIPIVYNTGSYDSQETLRSLCGRVNIYLADMKYYKEKTAKELSDAGDYPEVAKAALYEMVRQQPKPVIESGLMKKGVIVRLLLLPMKLAECKLSLNYLYEAYGDSVYISLMSQYTPIEGMPSPLNRAVTRQEYSELVSYAEKLGVVNAFTQEHSSVGSSFTPDFSN